MAHMPRNKNSVCVCVCAETLNMFTHIAHAAQKKQKLHART